MFPLRVGKSKVPRAAAHERALEALDMVGLADLASRPAPNLSARAVKVRAAGRRVSLDKGLRGRMRDQIRSVQQRLGITTVFVTHDQDEALAVSDDVVVMNGGHVVERGLPQEIYSFPRNEFTARFLGVSNSLDGVVDAVAPDGVTVRVGDASMVTSANAHGVAKDDEVSVFLRPESFRLAGRRGRGRARSSSASITATAGTTTCVSPSNCFACASTRRRSASPMATAYSFRPTRRPRSSCPGSRRAPGSAAPASPSLPITA